MTAVPAALPIIDHDAADRGWSRPADAGEPMGPPAVTIGIVTWGPPLAGPDRPLLTGERRARGAARVARLRARCPALAVGALFEE